MHGHAKAFIDTLAVRFANAFGTPNVISSDHVCHVPRLLGAEVTLGYLPVPDLLGEPECFIVWGANKLETAPFRNKDLIKAREKGAISIVIDPFKTPMAESADLFLQLKPGTDLLVALGILHVIIRENLYDASFVEKWTVGFDRLKSHLENHPPNRVEKLSWVPAVLIEEAARLYASSHPSCLFVGNATDGTPDSFQASRALSMLMAITGNLDISGGDLQELGSGFRWCDTEGERGRMRGRWSSQMELRESIPHDMREKIKIGPRFLPDFRYTNPKAFVESVLEGKPYRIQAAFVQGSKPLSSWNNIMRVREAFSSLDFLVVSDLFMTPTAALADIVFPVAGFLEFDGIRMGGPGGLARFQRKVAQVGECRPDHEVLNELARRLGMGEVF